CAGEELSSGMPGEIIDPVAMIEMNRRTFLVLDIPNLHVKIIQAAFGHEFTGRIKTKDLRKPGKSGAQFQFALKKNVSARQGIDRKAPIVLGYRQFFVVGGKIERFSGNAVLDRE